MRTLGLIPARYASTRFPGKPLHLIAGQPLLQRVVQRCQQASSLAEVVVATDDERIAAVARTFCRVEMTRADHPSGSDRIAEVAARCDCDAVVNIQGDEPLMDPAVIDAVAGALADAEMSTAATAIRDAAEYDNRDVIRRGSSYGVPMFSLSEPARACAFVVENIDIGASYPIPAQRVYAQPIQVFNITEESPCS